METEELHPCQLKNLKQENDENGSNNLIEVKQK